MTEENKSIETTEAAVEEEEELLPIEEEFKSLYADANRIKERWLRIAKTKEEEKDTVSATLIKLIANDVITLVVDVIAASGGGFEELNVAVADQAEEIEGNTLSDEEVVQINTTLMINVGVLEKLAGTAKEEDKAAISSTLELNQGTLTLLREMFGEEIVKASEEQISQVSSA